MSSGDRFSNCPAWKVSGVQMTIFEYPLPRMTTVRPQPASVIVRRPEAQREGRADVRFLLPAHLEERVAREAVRL